MDAVHSSNITVCHLPHTPYRVPLADVLSGHYSAVMKEIAMKERKEKMAERIAVYQQQRGFTLLELLIVLAIIGILSAIAIPSYRDYIIRGKITEATSNLGDMRIKLEQFYRTIARMSELVLGVRLPLCLPAAMHKHLLIVAQR